MLERRTITHPALPEALDGLTVLHLSDFHVRRPVTRHRWWPALERLLRDSPADVIALTGDYPDKPGHEDHGLDLLRRMARVWRPRCGVLAIHGNHDTIEFRRRAAEAADIQWIGGGLIDLPLGDPGPPPGGGPDWPGGVVAVMGSRGGRPPQLVLAHVPTALVPLAGFNIPIVLAGHTHAGQIRVSPRFAPHTSSDTPSHLAGGLLRSGDTVMAVSRAIGDGVVEGLRINCPRQVCLFTLARGPMPDGAWTGGRPRQVVAW